MLQCPDRHDEFKSPWIAHNPTELSDGESLRFVNSKIMQLGHRIVKHRGPVDVKADSFVVETDAEHPVDRRPLSEAVRETGRLCARLIDGDKAPCGDKIFSVREPRTRWISKGKAGRSNPARRSP